jgi:Uma2 family endonuclease
MTLLAEPPTIEAKTPVVAPASKQGLTMADLWESLGRVPLERIIMKPVPGSVSFDHFEQIDARVEGRLVELVDKTLVEKSVGRLEAEIAGEAFFAVKQHVKANKLGGKVVPGDGPLRMKGGNSRLPDVSWTSPQDVRDPERKQRVPQEAPTLAVEVISESNTEAEMDKKLREYFASGCRLAWLLYPATRVVRVYKDADHYHTLTADDMLTGGDVLPGFEVKVAALFDV